MPPPFSPFHRLRLPIMATATLSKTQHVPETAKHSTQTESVIVNGAASGTLSTLDALSSNIGTWAQDILDRSFPPDQRQAFLAKIKAFVLANPKISVRIEKDWISLA